MAVAAPATAAAVAAAVAAEREADAPGTVAVMDPADATSRIAEVAAGQLSWSDVTAILGAKLVRELAALIDRNGRYNN